MLSKQLEHDTVEVEDEICREELELKSQGANVIDNIKTL